MKNLIALTALLILLGCNASQPRAITQVKPLPFDFPGLFSGITNNGTLTLRLSADGTGSTCFQNKAGELLTGEATFTGVRIHTNEAIYTLKHVGPNQIKASSGFSFAIFNRVEIAPSDCRTVLGEP